MKHGQRKVFPCGHKGRGQRCNACGKGERVHPRKLTEAERAEKVRRLRAMGRAS